MLRKLLTVGGLYFLVAVPPAGAGEAEWLHFPMYPRDTAHAVHLAALKKRPDGLLESATRYPRHPGEPWSEVDSAIGWYNYERRLIDCQSGRSFSYEEQLLARDGGVIARRRVPPEDFANWKDSLSVAEKADAWPRGTEIFLACAAAGDPALLVRRRQAERQHAPRLTYRPNLEALVAESKGLAGRSQFQPKLAELERPLPRTAREVAERQRKQYRDWLASFLALPTTSATVRKVAVPTADSISTAWLKDKPFQVTLLASSGDGAVRVIDHQPSYYDLPMAFREPPAKAAQAVSANLEMRVDCLSGQEVAMQLAWLDGNGKALAIVPITAKGLLEDLRRQGEGPRQINLKTSPLQGRALLVCRAAAAECTGRLPSEDGSEATPTAIAGDSPEEVLIALRQRDAERTLIDVPACRFGEF